jgi:hypothetical protein
MKMLFIAAVVTHFILLDAAVVQMPLTKIETLREKLIR